VAWRYSAAVCVDRVLRLPRYLARIGVDRRPRQRRACRLHFSIYNFLRGRVSLAVSGGAAGAPVAIANTAAVVGFGSVAKLTPGFQSAVEAMNTVTGRSAHRCRRRCQRHRRFDRIGFGKVSRCRFLRHITSTWASIRRRCTGSSRSLPVRSTRSPDNGYVVTTLRGICKESYEDAYPAVGVLTVVVPALGTALAIALPKFLRNRPVRRYTSIPRK
jgi:hypothetical protein